MKCPSCTRDIKEGLKFCSHCGIRIVSGTSPETKTPRKLFNKESAQAIASKWKIFAGLMLAVFGAYLFYFGYDAYQVQKNYKLCQFHRRTGSYHQGAEICERIIDRRPRKIELWVELAKCYKGMDDSKKALETIRNGLKWGKEPELYAIQGELLCLSGIIQGATTALEKALAIDGDNRLANQYMGYLLHDKNESSKAIPYLEKALKDAGHKEVLEINEVLGDMYFRSKNYKKAIELYIAVQELDMNLIGICMKLTSAYLSEGNFEKAFLESDRCAQISPENKEAQKLKEAVRRQKEHLDILNYVLTRKKLDDILMILYSALLAYIERFNMDPDAFIGEENTELDEMIRDTEGLMESYRKLAPPDVYYHVHAVTLGIVSSLVDTMSYLERCVKTGEQQHYTTLAQYLFALEKKMTKLLAIWDKEFKDLDLDALLKNAGAVRNATGTVELPSYVKFFKPLCAADKPSTFPE